MKKPRAPREFLFVILRGSIAATGSPSAGNQPFLRWRYLRTPLLVAGVLAVAMQLVEYWGLFAGTEGRVLDLFLRSRPAEKQTIPVILIEIDDEAYSSCFRGTTPLDAGLLKQIVLSLVTANRPPGSEGVLGVDIITDSKLQKNLDAYAGLRELGNPPTPVVWAAGADVSITRGSSFWSWFFKGSEDELLVQPTGVLGKESMQLAQATPFEWGLPVFPPDEDLRLRRFPRKISMIFANGARLPAQDSWARKIASKLPPSKIKPSKIKEDVREVLLSYSIRPVHYPLLSLYDCDPKAGTITPKESKKDSEEFKKFKKQADEKAVLLLGGTFSSSGDFHETSEGRTSGLEINARAVQAELAGNGIHEVNRLWMLVADTIIGFLIGGIFGHEQSIRLLTWGNWLMVALGLTLICVDLKGVSPILVGCVVLLAIGCMIQWFARTEQRTRVLILGSLGAVLVVVLASYLALRFGYVWLSCVGVALGVNLHVICEAFLKDVGASKAEQ